MATPPLAAFTMLLRATTPAEARHASGNAARLGENGHSIENDQNVSHWFLGAR
jgi:hypothetical protein